MPQYFLDFEEQDLITDIPDFKDTYYVLLHGGTVAGAGGFALNSDDTVSLCWGMLHKHYHRQGLGKALLAFRLNEIARQFPGKTIVNTTSQHAAGFFEKFGFSMVSVEENGFGPGLHACKMELKK